MLKTYFLHTYFFVSLLSFFSESVSFFFLFECISVSPPVAYCSTQFRLSLYHQFFYLLKGMFLQLNSIKNIGKVMGSDGSIKKWWECDSSVCIPCYTLELALYSLSWAHMHMTESFKSLLLKKYTIKNICVSKRHKNCWFIVTLLQNIELHQRLSCSKFQLQISLLMVLSLKIGQ